MNLAAPLILAAAAHPSGARGHHASEAASLFLRSHPVLAMFAGRWQAEATVLVPAALAALLYAAGWLRLRRAAGRNSVPAWRAALFALGLLALLWALEGPLDDLGDASFAFHMIQHESLILVAAPLLLLGLPAPVFAWALPRRWNRATLPWFSRRRMLRRLAEWLGRPAVAWAFFNAAFALWHLPPLYNAAQGNDWVHYSEHITFLVAALVYWSRLVGLGPHARRLSAASAAGYAAANMPVGMLLGIWFLFSPRPVYAHYEAAENPFGWSVLMDQQLAGAIHLLVGTVYLALVGVYLARWMVDLEEAESVSKPSASR
ncbi:MAG: cytochrome c oxidase assembly protein [Bacillota bacterium]|nr:cytochrome c oxidase assembly protein [Bacillota bacterium]